MKQAKPNDLVKLRDLLRGEVIAWLGLFGREPVNLEMYQDSVHDQNFHYLQAWGFLDESTPNIDMTLTLNERAMTFLKDPSVIKKHS